MPGYISFPDPLPRAKGLGTRLLECPATSRSQTLSPVRRVWERDYSNARLRLVPRPSPPCEGSGNETTRMPGYVSFPDPLPRAKGLGTRLLECPATSRSQTLSPVRRVWERDYSNAQLRLVPRPSPPCEGSGNETTRMPGYALARFILFVYLQNVPEILRIYESEFNKLSERYFVEFPWPDAERIAPLVQKGQFPSNGYLPIVLNLFVNTIVSRSSFPNPLQRTALPTHLCQA